MSKRSIALPIVAVTMAVAIGAIILLYPRFAVAGVTSLLAVIFFSVFPQLVMPVLLALRSSAELVGDIPLRGLPISNIATTVTSIIPIALLVFILLRRFSIPKVILPFLPFFLIASSGICFSPNKIEFLIDYLRIFSLLAVMWATMLCLTEKNAKLFFTGFFCGASVPVILGTYQILFRKGLFQLGQFNRAYGSLRHPSDYGYFLLLAIVVLLGIWAGYYRKRMGLLFCGVLALLMINLLFTFSRMVWILFIFSVALYVFLLAKSKKSNSIVAAVMLLSIILGVIFINQISSRFGTDFIFSGRGGENVILGIPVTGSPSSRLIFIEAAINEFLQRPLLGNGLGYFYYYLSPHLFEQKVEVHSDLIKLLCETGIVGTSLFIYALFSIFIYVWKHYKLTKDAFVKALCLIGIVMIGTKALQLCFDATLRLADVEFYWWAMLGIILGYVKLDKLRERTTRTV